MGQQAASYRVRLARADEVPRPRVIEDAAGTIFSGLGLIDEALDVSFPLIEAQVFMRRELDEVGACHVAAPGTSQASSALSEATSLPGRSG